jgi:hypothetical protein
MLINHFRTDNTTEIVKRGASHGLYKSNNIKYAGYDLDMEIDGSWLEAINICRIRSMYVPYEILDDFYYTHKGN